MSPTIEKQCQRCGTGFLPLSNRQVYCSPCGRGQKATCETCGQDFATKSNTTGLYCSRACYVEARRLARLVACEVCGTMFDPKYDGARACSRACGDRLRRKERPLCQTCGKPCLHAYRKFCSRECARSVTGKGARRPEGSKRTEPSGYVLIKVGTEWRHEHRVVMEQVLGHPLVRGENVHHLNGERGDNRPENLELWTRPQPTGVRADELPHCPTCTCGRD